MQDRPRFVVAAFASLAVAGGGCSRAPRQAPPPGTPAVVVFNNESSYEAAVFMVTRTGRQVRIGTVQPGRKDTLRVAGSSLPAGGGMAIVARLRAVGRVPSTGPFTLAPGDTIAVTLPLDARTLNLLPAR